jgi:hypothetical protein
LLSLAAVLGASACAQALMNLPEGLVGKAETYPVHGRQGLLLFEPQMSFGPYRTVSIHRGLAASEQTSVATGLTSSVEHDSARQPFDFVLQGPGPGAWRGSCVASSDVEVDTQVVGVHAGTNGSGFDREQMPVSATSGYVCQLDGPGAEHWELEADEQLSGGTVRDATGALVVGIRGIRESWTWKHPALEGDTLVSPDGETWAAVQRSFDGAVYLSRELDPMRRSALAAICTALLIAGH